MREHGRIERVWLGRRMVSFQTIVSRRTIKVTDSHSGLNVEIAFADLVAWMSHETLWNYLDSAIVAARVKLEAQERQLAQATKRRIRERDGEICSYCRRPGRPRGVDPDGKSWHIDHVMPKAHGGDDDDANLVLSCAACNMAKGDSLDARWPAQLEAVRNDDDEEQAS